LTGSQPSPMLCPSMFCRDWTIVKTSLVFRRAKVLTCRSWKCENCYPMRRAQLMGQAVSGEPNRFLTLTINPQVGESPSERLRILSHAWRVIMLRLRRMHNDASIDYLAVVEQTKLGEPHLHILLRSPFIPQPLLSSWMDELARSPIVDIRVVKNPRKAAAYVAKYVTKQPHQFEGSKRYWQSRNYQLSKDDWKPEPALDGYKWLIDRRPITLILQEWVWEGWAPRSEPNGSIYAVPGNFMNAPPLVQA